MPEEFSLITLHSQCPKKAFENTFLVGFAARYDQIHPVRTIHLETVIGIGSSQSMIVLHLFTRR